MTIEKFIEKARATHGDKYDYSKVEFNTIHDKICIICPEHGEFKQGVRQHYRGNGCPKCGVERRTEAKRDTTESFIEKSKKVHGNKYDYSLVEYVDSMTKVKLICHKKDENGVEHGVFYTRPDGHLSTGIGCPMCKRETLSEKLSLNKEDFIERSRKKHGDRYDYSKVIYTDARSKVCIICPEHGEFWQGASSHMYGRTCPKCAEISRRKKRKKTTEQFIAEAKHVHGDRYDYSKVEYKGVFDPVTIICKEHGEFKQVPTYHLNGCGCQKCGAEMSNSREEIEIYEYCCDLLGKEYVISNDRDAIAPYELDVYIPSMKIAIEYNGLYWHSDAKKNRNYHIDKLNRCKKCGIKLIQVFEDEYLNHKDIVLSKIAHLLNCGDYEKKIYGRNVVVSEINYEIAKEFLNENHIQGFGKGCVHLGGYHGDELVGVMSFIKRLDEWELVRFASKNRYKCCGVGGKLFKYFVDNYGPEYVKSFADRRWTIDENDNLYVKIGFKFDSYVVPDYKYFIKHEGEPVARKHKFGFRKKILNRKYGFPLTMTENEMTTLLGAIKIYDCGLIKYVWKKQV